MKGSLESTYHNLRVNCSESSVSSSSSITPSSGYSSYEILDQDSDNDLQSCHDSHQAKNRASKEAVSDSRSKSVPIISRKINTQDYTTQIKPASHRLENHSYSSSTESSMSSPWYWGNYNSEKESNINRNKNKMTGHSVKIRDILSIPR